MAKIFDIFLETKDFEITEKLPSVDGDEKYLVQEDEKFKFLSDLPDSSYVAIKSDNMNDLIRELDLLLGELSNIQSLEHIRRIKNLANRCKDLKESRLIISPFVRGT